MKRRNADVGKMRRPMKRNKITEGIYGSTLLYLKFLILWVLVILADFILEFRFEFLWPFYLLLRSVYDSFKYQGLAFSLFFVCVALTSDMLCYFFIPVHWLFFAASTYVWVQYVWHTDRGICAPTIILWVLFVYLEAAVRLRDVKHMPGHMDLCRPFAAHCIGYPVVTLGFGFKSYIGYRMRQRKQRDVAKENEFYLQLMQQALPADTTTTTTADVAEQQQQDTSVIHTHNHNASIKVQQQNNRQSHEKNGHVMNGVGTMANGVGHTSKSHRKLIEKSREHVEHEHRHADRQRVNHVHTNGTAIGAVCNTGTTSVSEENSAVMEMSENRPVGSTASVNQVTKKKDKKELDKEREAAEYLQRLEMDTKRLRADLQSSRQSEQELRIQVASLTTSDKVAKGELSAMQRELEELQNKLQNALNCKASDRQTISNLERRLADERRNRSNCESQLAQERKNRKAEEARAAQAAAAAAAAQQQSSRNNECTEQCKSRRRELETEINELRSSKHWAEERCAVLERENATLAEQLRDTEILMSALATMQEKNAHLENSLSAETRIKLDLFSALGEAKRQLEIRENTNRAQEKEIEELKSKIAQVLAVMPNDAFGSPTPTNNISRVRLAESPPGSTLDPNATAYTPKSSLIASTEA